MPHQNLTDHFWTSCGSSSYPKALLFPCDPFASVLHLTLEPFSKLVSDLVVFSADLILAIKPLEPADRKMAAGHVLEVLDERIVHRGAPPRAPTTGNACAATFWVTTNPKRAATWVTNLRRIPAVERGTVERWRREPEAFLDVRNPDEFEAGNLPGFRSAPAGSWCRRSTNGWACATPISSSPTTTASHPRRLLADPDGMAKYPS